MKLFLAAAALAALTTTALAGPQVQQVIYNVDAVSKCSQAANGPTNLQANLRADLKDGLQACSVALSDPAMTHRAITRRGIRRW